MTKVTSKSYYKNLKDLNEEWEDYEEPKKYYYITSCGEITHRGYRLWENESVYDKKRKEIGNCFETKEEAEKALGKLKAWKRLKDNGFKFTAYQLQELNINFFLDHGYTKMGDDLDLLFGGEK